MVLVDTSVLIDYLKDKNNTQTKKFSNIVDLQIPFGITSHIYQELLQGTSSQSDFNTLKKYLDTFTFYFPKDGIQSYAESALIYFKCRRQGLTIKSTIDCLIVQICLENKLKLLHKDNDFLNIQKIFKKLEFY
ncbi:MAG: type II toxin-antitoxin system VapC family toxin [Candidatus Anammoxibacter sp.]